MSKVFLLNTNKQPLNPIHPGRARMLLSQGKAAIFRHYPFTLILKKEILNPKIEPLRIKIDPGAKTTGLALLNDSTGEVVWVAELHHRGFQIRDALTSRRQIRRLRRNRKTRYRQPRFLNRTRPSYWFPPSLNSRVANILTWIRRLSSLCQITAISQELVRFDTQQMQDSEISGIGYQQGTLAGYEIREFLLEKWNRTCAYCEAKDIRLEIDHVQPRSKGGSNRLSNLCLACVPCNQKKGNQNIKDFLKNKLELLKKPKCHIELLRKWGVKANLEVPILQGEQLWGLLMVQQCRTLRAWQPLEIELMKQLANQLAIAIQQAELYQQLQAANEQLQRLASSDGLTHVANRRRFDEYLLQQLLILAREKQPLSLILCDIDFFKSYNDTYGHQAGDECLRLVAKAIQRAVKRPADLVARYGGEEFAVILPNTDLKGALRVAKEIQIRVKDLQIPHFASEVNDCITLSAGVACLIATADISPKELIAGADRALYQAKNLGRDRIVMCSESCFSQV